MFAFRSMSQKRSSQIKSVLQTCSRMRWMPVLAWAFDSADLFVGAGGGGSSSRGYCRPGFLCFILPETSALRPYLLGHHQLARKFYRHEARTVMEHGLNPQSRIKPHLFLSSQAAVVLTGFKLAMKTSQLLSAMSQFPVESL